MRPRPSTLAETCGFNRSGRALTHVWADAEFYGYRACFTGETLRLKLIRCKRCDAFALISMGGDPDALEELLQFCTPIDRISRWISHEQPGYEHVSERLPATKRKGAS
jgi:hypothetical protein